MHWMTHKAAAIVGLVIWVSLGVGLSSSGGAPVAKAAGFNASPVAIVFSLAAMDM